MKSPDEIKSILQIHKQELARKYNIKNLALFGSAARGDINENSDIDILVEFDKPIGLDFVLLADELENLLQSKVDLVSYNSIKPKLFDYIKQDLIYV